MTPTLTIPQAIFDAMLDHAKRELPNECCGLLAGAADQVALHIPLVNELQSPTAYRSDPQSMLNAMKAMRVAGTEIVAIYHSHPTSEPIPSKRDLAENEYGEVVQVIISLQGKVPDVRAWLLSGQQFNEAAWQIGE
jgi:proteasome lid subunit RPN8/RPN11